MVDSYFVSNVSLVNNDEMNIFVQKTRSISVIFLGLACRRGLLVQQVHGPAHSHQQVLKEIALKLIQLSFRSKVTSKLVK